MRPIKLENQSAGECTEKGCRFWTDGINVYYLRNQVPLKGINPEKTWCWRNFAFDDRRIFLKNQLLKGVSSADFTILNHAFVRTQSHILTESGRIKCSITDCVKVLDKGLWYGDEELDGKGYILVNEEVWYEGHWSGLVKLSRANSKKFTSLKDGVFGKDDERIYAFGKIVKGASAKDFKKIEETMQCKYYTSNGYLYFQDTRMMPISLIDEISIVGKDNILVNGTKYYGDLKVEEQTK